MIEWTRGKRASNRNVNKRKTESEEEEEEEEEGRGNLDFYVICFESRQQLKE